MRDTVRREDPEETGVDLREGEHEGQQLTSRVGSRSLSYPCPPDRSTPAEGHVEEVAYAWFRWEMRRGGGRGGRGEGLVEDTGRASSTKNRAEWALWLRMPAEAEGSPGRRC